MKNLTLMKLHRRECQLLSQRLPREILSYILRCHTFHPRFNFLLESQSEKVIIRTRVIVSTCCHPRIRISIWQHTSVIPRLDFPSLWFSPSRWRIGEVRCITDKAFNHCFAFLHFRDLNWHQSCLSLSFEELNVQQTTNKVFTNSNKDELLNLYT